MTDSDGHFPEHLSHDEYLRRRIRDVDASMQNLASIVFARLDAIEQHLGLEPEAWRGMPVTTHVRDDRWGFVEITHVPGLSDRTES